jgi:TatD DNase family protein
MFVDTHCHIHDSEFVKKYTVSADELIEEARTQRVQKIICVGTSLQSSEEAVAFAESRDGVYVSLALHPHETALYTEQELTGQMRQLAALARKRPKALVAIGECGLDYFYHHDSQTRRKQEDLFRQHIELAHEYQLPLIFHIRDAFDDFFRIIDDYEEIRGVVHSFSATKAELKGVIERGLYVGLNGIMTFTKRDDQLAAAKAVPLDFLMLETDAPFLTPAPFRGKICQPKHVVVTAEFLSQLRRESIDVIEQATTRNALQLFSL